MTALDAFLPYIRVHVSGLPAPVILQEVRSAAIRFCAISRAWKGFQVMDISAGVAAYAIPVPTGAVLGVLEEVYVNGESILPQPLDELRARWRHWTAVEGSPLFYTQLDPDTVTLVPKPVDDSADGLEMRAHYKPAHDAAELPDFLLDQHAQAIASGALSTLMSMPDLPCYNPNQAMAHQAVFEAAAYKANTQADRSFTRAPRRVVGRFM